MGKIESDMEKVLNRMDGLKTEMQAEMKSFNKEIKILYWVILAATTILTIVISLNN